MAALHEALKSLGPIDFSNTSLDELKPFLSEAFRKGQLIVDSVPISAQPEDIPSLNRPSRSGSSASSASEISLSSARSTPPPSDVEALQKEWRQVKMNAKDNPLGMSVYKLGGKDGKGSWFARRSVHEGLGFTKWKRGLEREFPETMKVQGGPGEGNIRGIGGERRVEYTIVEGLGKMEVYLLSAQFPGPTTPRDFVTMFLTSDQALSDLSGEQQEVPRHFMVISRPCNHLDAPPRDGFIRGQYESVEFIREIPLKKGLRKSASTTNLPAHGSFTRNRSASSLGREAIIRNAKKNISSSMTENEIPVGLSTDSHSETRTRGKTISFDRSRGLDAKGEVMDVPREDDDIESNPVEWIMITRSDPGGSVPRFMIERGTPGGIVADASKFLNWACAKDIEDFDSDDETLTNDDQDQNARKDEHNHHHNHDTDLHNFQTNGHLAGIEEAQSHSDSLDIAETTSNGGLYGMVAGVAGAAGQYIASHTPALISDHLPKANGVANIDIRRESTSSMESASSVGSFASALEGYDNDVSSIKTTDSDSRAGTLALQDKELQKLEDRKRRLDEKLSKARERETNKKSEDSAKEEETIRKAEERHEREVKKQEEKYKKEVEKLEKRKQKEEQKAEARKRKAIEKDEKTKTMRQLEELKAEVGVLRKEKEILRSQVGDLQAENTALAARIGRLGMQGEELLRDVRADMGRTGRLRANSLKGLTRAASFKSSSSIEKDKENGNLLKD